MAHHHDHDDDEPCNHLFDMTSDPASVEIVARENEALRQIFAGFENISLNLLYSIMEIIHVQAQASTIENKRDQEIKESIIDSLFTILVRLTEDFPEPEREKIRQLLLDDDFLEEAQSTWFSMIESLQDDVN